MKTYEVISAAKRVSVRVGDQANSQIKELKGGEKFTTLPAFAQDLLAKKLIKEVVSESSKPEAVVNSRKGKESK